MKTRAHFLIVRVVFDRACTPAVAVDAFRDCVIRDPAAFYLSQTAENSPSEFIIRSVKHAAEKVGE